MDLFFVLDDNHNPVAVEDTKKWAQWMFDNEDNRRVGLTQIGSVLVSTIFLGIAHCYANDKPLLFETMVFGLSEDNLVYRTTTWEEAVAQHEAACEKVR